jgi:hypothetical protein
VRLAPAQEGGTVPTPQVYDLVLQAVGRTLNGKDIAAGGLSVRRASAWRQRRRLAVAWTYRRAKSKRHWLLVAKSKSPNWQRFGLFAFHAQTIVTGEF